MKNISKYSISAVLCVFLLSANMLVIVGSSDHLIVKDFDLPEAPMSLNDNLVYTFSFVEPGLNEWVLYDELFTEIDLPSTYSVGNEPGTPLFNVLSVKILLPFGMDLADINVICSEEIEVDVGSKGYDLKQNPVVPYQPPVRLDKDTSDSLVFDEDTYNSYDPVPATLFESLGINHCRGYTILTVDLHPEKYIPGDGALFYYPEMIVELNLTESGIVNQFFRNNLDDRAWVESLVMNPDMISSYDAIDPDFDDPLYADGLCDPSDNGGNGYDYVVITRESLADFTASYNWTDFINRKQLDGLDTIVVTVEDITDCPDYWNSTVLFNDSQAKIREFCKDAYEDWGISYVLIAGDHDGAAAIPRRLMDTAYESNIECDIYWSNLDDTFNADGDNDWGEAGDSGFDLYSELFIGSLPCDEPVDISNWMTKSFFYADSFEQDYLENAAFYGGDTGWSCQGDDFIDFTLYGTDTWLGPDPNHDGPWPSFLGFLYGFDTWNTSNPGMEFNNSVRWTAEPPNPGWLGGSESAAIAGLKDAINNDHVTFINGIAHANSDMSLDVGYSSWESDYHNTKPFFVHDYGCHCGDMSASDDGVLHSMLFSSDVELAFACVYNTCYGWGNLDCTNSSSALQQKLFWDYLFNFSKCGGTLNWQMGKAQAWTKDAMAPTINWDPSYGTWRAILQGCLLFGDPAQSIKPPLSPDHNVGVHTLDVPSHVIPDEMIYVNSTIVNNGLNNESNVVVSFRVDGFEVDSTTIPFMETQTVQDVSFTWTPSQGFYTVTINVSIPGVTEDIYYDNEKSKIVIAGPDIAVTSVDVPTYAGKNILTEISGTIENLGTTDETITVYLKVDGNNEDSQSIFLNSSSSTAVTFNWYPTQVGTYPVGLAAEVSGVEPYTGNNEMTKDITVFSAKGHVLLVDDDTGDDYESYFENALLASSYLYDVWVRDTDGSPPSSTMLSYDAVIWFTGDDYTSTLQSDDINNLEVYLDSGGNLFITGQDFGYDIRTDPFYTNYMHATYQVDDTNIFTVEGIPGDPIGDSLLFDISSGDGANNQQWPSGISPISPALTCFEYQGSSYDGGIYVDTGTYKLVYFSFGFEAISNMIDRQVVMDRVLTWMITQQQTSTLITNLVADWNFVSLPFNQLIDIADIIVKYNGADYTWAAATGVPIVDPNVYGWDRSLHIYVPATTMEPGYGYWIYAYFDCELWVENISATSGNYITDLELTWNVIGVPYNQTVNIADLIVNYNWADYTWAEATAPSNGPIVDPNIYGWDRTQQMYLQISDVLEPGYAYWMYAYNECVLKKL